MPIAVWSAVGIAFTLAWEAVVGGISFGRFTFHPGMAAYVMLSLVPVPLLWPGSRSLRTGAWVFLASVALADLPMMALRGSGLSVTPIILLVGGIVAIAGLLPAFWPRRTSAASALGRREFLAVMGIALLAIAASQTYNRVQRAGGVSNEHRSIYVGPVEVHHINWGLFMVVASCALWPELAKWPLGRALLIVFLGLGFGFVWDQWFYYLLREPSDDAYFERVTLFSGLAATVFCPLVWVVMVTHAAKGEGIDKPPM